MVRSTQSFVGSFRIRILGSKLKVPAFRISESEFPVSAMDTQDRQGQVSTELGIISQLG